MDAGSTVYRAAGQAFWQDGGASYYIEEGTVTGMVDPQGRQLVDLYGVGSAYVPLDERWRATKVEATRDAAAAMAAHGEKMRQRAADIEAEAGAAT